MLTYYASWKASFVFWRYRILDVPYCPFLLVSLSGLQLCGADSVESNVLMVKHQIIIGSWFRKC